MRDNETMAKSNIAADCCAQRQPAHSLLREHADRLRREAGRLHQEADRLELLSNHAHGIQGHAEEALYRLVLDALRSAPPRAY